MQIATKGMNKRKLSDDFVSEVENIANKRNLAKTIKRKQK